MWIDAYVWPAETAAVPHDGTVLVDRVGLPAGDAPFREQLDRHRDRTCTRPANDEVAELLRVGVAAKYLARGDTANLARVTRTVTGPRDDPAGAWRALTAILDRVAASAPATSVAATRALLDLCADLATSVPGVGCAGTVHPLRITDKSLVTAVAATGHELVVKTCTSADPYWRRLFAREVDVLRTFAHSPPPVPVPALLDSDDSTTVTAQLAGMPLHADRYPQQRLNPTAVAPAVAALTGYARWRPPDGSPPADTGPAEHLYTRAVEHLDRADGDLFTRLLARCGRWDTAHGDPLPSNLLASDEGCGLVDLEHAGRYAPGFDLAVLRTVLTAQPAETVALIDRAAAAGADPAGYGVNLVVVAARELRIHTDFVDGRQPGRRRLLERLWRHALDQLRAAGH